MVPIHISCLDAKMGAEKPPKCQKMCPKNPYVIMFFIGEKITINQYYIWQEGDTLQDQPSNVYKSLVDFETSL